MLSKNELLIIVRVADNTVDSLHLFPMLGVNMKEYNVTTKEDLPLILKPIVRDSGKIILLVDANKWNNGELYGRIYSSDNGAFTLDRVASWIMEPAEMKSLHGKTKPILVIVTGGGQKSEMFNKKLLPRLLPLLPDIQIERVAFNDNGIATSTVPKELYDWVGWFPFIALFNGDSWKTGNLDGVVFRGIRDEYWENEYKFSPDPSQPSRYDEHDIVAWIEMYLSLVG